MRDAVTLSLRQVTIELRHYWCFTISLYALLLSFAALMVIAINVSVLTFMILVIMLFEHLGNNVFQLLEPPTANAGKCNRFPSGSSLDSDLYARRHLGAWL